MPSLFDCSADSFSPDYLALRDSPRTAPLRDIAQRLWTKFQPYADPSFPDLFAQQLHARFWEMYLAVCLLDKGFELVPKASSRGPDVHLILNQRDVWIEVVAPSPGEGTDAVPSIEEKPRFEPIPEDKIILRFTNALSGKLRKREQYLEASIVRASDPFVIALNGKGIEMTIFDGPLPAIIKAVYPVGPYQVTINTRTLETVRSGYVARFQIRKTSDAAVPTDAFLQEAYSGISGVLYSDAALWDMPPTPGNEMLFVHNSVASSPLPREWLCSAKECHKEGNGLVISQCSPCA
jgi:hypothetical protein